jgi:hypothetical protein
MTGRDTVPPSATRRDRGNLRPSLALLDDLDVDALAIGLTSDHRPLGGAAGFLDWRLCGQLSEFLLSGEITGKIGEKVLMPTLKRVRANRIFLFGWGPSDGLDKNLDANIRWMSQVLKDARVESVAVAMPEPASHLTEKSMPIFEKRLGPLFSGLFEPDPEWAAPDASEPS